ncbi:hypothetical protein OIDMADRAFT_49115 [Oidiodendron maius Zn]|uniref:Uncharacterized protein n=1 Tax=Oidiodendron maius (strain Zn) TaxID=913774 RepID=A0A0C3HRH4_OIDMZ|nr:hypothetical protein OIDMADRAFT_49115 [Oidiodendron maius Zn]
MAVVVDVDEELKKEEKEERKKKTEVVVEADLIPRAVDLVEWTGCGDEQTHKRQGETRILGQAQSKPPVRSPKIPKRKAQKYQEPLRATPIRRRQGSPSFAEGGKTGPPRHEMGGPVADLPSCLSTRLSTATDPPNQPGLFRVFVQGGCCSPPLLFRGTSSRSTSLCAISGE